MRVIDMHNALMFSLNVWNTSKIMNTSNKLQTVCNSLLQTVCNYERGHNYTRRIQPYEDVLYTSPFNSW